MTEEQKILRHRIVLLAGLLVVIVATVYYAVIGADLLYKKFTASVSGLAAGGALLSQSQQAVAFSNVSAATENSEPIVSRFNVIPVP